MIPQPPDKPDTDTDSWVALAKWNIGEWSDQRYAAYLEANDPDDVAVAILIERLRNQDISLP